MPKKQLEIPGTERPVIKEIDKAADRYVALRDQRIAVLKKELDAKAVLIDAMQRHVTEVGRDGDDNLIYQYGDHVVIVSDRIQVKVKSAEAPETDEE